MASQSPAARRPRRPAPRPPASPRSSTAHPIVALAPAGQPPLINWHVVSFAASLSFFLVAGLLAWIATHPAPKRHPEPAPEAMVDSSTSEEPAKASEPAEARSLVPVASSSPLRPLAPSKPRLQPAKQPVLRASRSVAQEPAPSLPPVAPMAPLPTETYGTQVSFLGIPQLAAEQARREHKLLFVLHVSGNFEESCFT